MLRTFSRSTSEGRCSSRMRQMFQNSVPRASSMPRWKPDLENGWHGKPAARTSCLGTFTTGSVSGTMSPCGWHVPVVLVDLGGSLVDLRGVDALAAQGAKRGVEAADAGEEVDEGEGGVFRAHVRSLFLSSDIIWD